MAEVCEGCDITWQEYLKQRDDSITEIGATVYQGVIDHPHLSGDAIIYEWPYGESYTYPLHMITDGFIDEIEFLPPNVTRTDLVRHMLKHGANVNQLDAFDKCPCVVHVQHIEIYNILEEHGADVSLTGECGYTILHTSVMESNYDFIRHLQWRDGIAQIVGKRSNLGDTAFDLMTDEDRIFHPDVASFLEEGMIPGRNTKRAR